MIDASFYMANQLYGLIVPRNHRHGAGVRTERARVGSHRPRRLLSSASSTAIISPAPASARARGCNTYQGHETFTGATVTPITSNNNNFVRGAEGEPVLISLDDAETLFHEFGHAIHGLVSTRELSGPRRHAARLRRVSEPSARALGADAPDPRSLRAALPDRPPMPQALVERVHNAATFNQGYATVEYLSSALVDMALHNRAERRSPMSTRSNAKRSPRIGMPREIAMRHRLPQFGHLFSSDSLFGRLLLLPLVGSDGRRHVGNVRSHAATCSIPTIAAGMRNIILARRQRHRPRRSLSPIPRPRSGRERTAARARLPDDVSCRQHCEPRARVATRALFVCLAQS